jgi:hypothetical protein
MPQFGGVLTLAKKDGYRAAGDAKVSAEVTAAGRFDAA